MLLSYQFKPFPVLLISIMAFLVFGCRSLQLFQAGDIIVRPAKPIIVSQVATLSIDTASDRPLKFKWAASRGRISGGGPSVTYMAPEIPGPDPVTVEVTDDRFTIIRNLTVQVVAAVAASTVPAYTNTPEPTSIGTPQMTPSPKIPTLAPTPTKTPIVHRVTEGENLWCISEKYYGKGSGVFFEELCTYNRLVIGEDCTKLQPGQRLTIPTNEIYEQLPDLRVPPGVRGKDYFCENAYTQVGG